MAVELWLICGSRNAGYAELCRAFLSRALEDKRTLYNDREWKPQILEGCCPNSADVYAEIWAKELQIDNQHYPAGEGNYLKRNIKMLGDCSEVIAFFDGWSYGTSFVIANAVARGIPVRVVMIK